MERTLRNYASPEYFVEYKNLEVFVDNFEDKCGLFPYFIHYKSDQIIHHEKRHTNYLQKLPKEILNEIIQILKQSEFK